MRFTQILKIWGRLEVQLKNGIEPAEAFIDNCIPNQCMPLHNTTHQYFIPPISSGGQKFTRRQFESGKKLNYQDRTLKENR